MSRWIHGAIKRRGRLRRYVARVYGEGGFTERGTIRVDVLKDIAKRKDNLGRAARLALTLRRFREDA